MIYHKSTGEYKEMMPGIQRKDLVHGPKSQLCEFLLAKGSVIPEHRHPHEQTGILHEGMLRLIIDGEAHDFGPGEAWSIPGDTPHAAEALEASVVWEVFSPPREDYLTD